MFIQSEKHFVERRLRDGRWQFLSEECTPRFLSNGDLADMMARGDFHLDACNGVRAFSPPPPSPLLVGPDAHAANLRKHEYVLACLDAPGGFRRSRPLLRGIIRDVAERRGEEAPGFTTVLTWIDEWKIHGQRIGTAAYSNRHDLKGRRRDILQDYQERAIEVGIEAWFQLGSKVQAYKLVCEEVKSFDREGGRHLNKAALGSRFVDDRGELRPPCRRTFERRCSNLSRFEQDWALKGPAYAKQHNRTWQKTPTPDRPYAEVEVDHTRLDILVIDDNQDLILGRPTLTFFRDRATCMILGYGLGFEEASYAAFVQGLKHATYPKGQPLSPAVENDWPCYGRIENLYVDNGLEFLGDSIRAAGRDLGFNLVRFQPRQPWLKGALERLYGTLNTGFCTPLLGPPSRTCWTATTTSTSARRRSP